MAFYADHPVVGVFEPPLQQGDILSPVPFVAFRIGTAATLAEQIDDIARVEVLDLTAGGGEEGRLVVGYARKPAIVVSQSCDIERGRNPLHIAPLRSFQTVFPGMTIGSRNFISRVNDLANPGKNPTSFPLPPIKRNGFCLPYSLVMFFEMQSITIDDVPKLKSLIKLRLSSEALGKFQERISFLFGRFATPDNFFLAEEHRGS